MSKTSINRYDFEFDENLIAQYPEKKRDESRLLVVNRQTNKLLDKRFKDIVDFFDDNMFLVLNNTKVLNARLFAKKESGGEVEIFLLEQLDGKRFKALLGGKWKSEGYLYINEYKLFVSKRDDEGIVTVDFIDANPFEIMDKYGHVPLPPYIKREDNELDRERYNTVFSKKIGSVAAPTAGLHFTEEIFDKLKEKGVEIFEITLNVGLGTFRPVKTEFIEDHKMHKESFSIEKSVADKINKLKKDGKKLVAVGTTVVRALESAASQFGEITPCENAYTDLFIREGYQFKVVDKMITNFHLPKSTLFILVCAFGGYDLMKKAYAHAVKDRYRFFSYGDAMFII
ncbi:S-adenosylmethionine:tRNA ribosyltransferase-isomerase [Deferribacter desulfuricans SSM1]|uniref:S-adenosylmethionine:tRNA ribosyltransferase-isomerase n=1 Tax=Deferribacter desulfuricans (strain DSM 14783 / JCM 11476 / NBRC 101012 / SSM1) TaxID=639282 RepID=D3PAI0_DEFDS|nr:tRNA preQ1(34) S-adenosylmethionine ribosyltransferase-isomerase QueA [Deferribacter desulfuricans]BAI79603.1 S-adenosylmethionine:tRNA ribosyltransferase-isomerase [Deferribacter desulfuricans SSM1]